MNISSIGAGKASRVWAAHIAAVSRAPVAAPPASEAKPAAVPSPRNSELASLDVRVVTRPSGGNQLTIADKTTGQIYCQLPPEQVVKVLEDVLRQMKQREDGSW